MQKSGDMCSFGRGLVPAHYVTHYRCDDHADGTVTDCITGKIVQSAPVGALRGFYRPNNT